MPKCKWCEKKGFFLKLSVNGLCKDCNDIIVPQVYRFGEQYKEAQKKLNGFFLPKGGLALIDEIKNSLFRLYEFEKKKIPTISPLPSELLSKKIYGRNDESLDELEQKLIQENIELERGLLSLSKISILGCNMVTIEGKFVFDNTLNAYVQKVDRVKSNQPAWTQFVKISLQYSDNNRGIYKEYYTSGKLRREIPFIIDEEYGNYLADGIERVYYEDLDSYGNETYTIIEENCYKKMERCGIWKRYSIDGGVMEETNYDKESESVDESFGLFVGTEQKGYYPDSGKIRIEEYKDWGKSYYENGKLMAEWSNKDYLKCGDYIEYYENGNVKMKCRYIDGVNRDRFMHKYFEDGKLKELWNYNKGKRKFVKKYYENGNLKTEWLYDENGNEITKMYYDKNGNRK